MIKKLVIITTICFITNHAFMQLRPRQFITEKKRIYLNPTSLERPVQSISKLRASTLEDNIWEWSHQKYGIDRNARISDAKNIPEVLHQLWIEICKQQPSVIYFPGCEEIPDLATAETLLEHLETCKDHCAAFGTDVVALLDHPEKGQHAPCTVFEIRKVGSTSKIPKPTQRSSSSLPNGMKIGSFNFDFSSDSLESDEDDWDISPELASKAMANQAEPTKQIGGFKFDFNVDEEWDDDWDIDPKLANAASLQQKTAKKQLLTDMEILKATKDWNEAVICKMGICPFTTSAEKAGLPLGMVHYPISRANVAEEIYRDYWGEVALLINSDQKKLSTTLLILPNFGAENVEGFDAFTGSLTQPLEPLGLEKHIQLVFFHPEYCFRDGQDRLGDSSAANYARRSPLPMINILRTNQVRAGQKGIPTGLVYIQNEKTLTEVGANELQKMLDTCDWSALSDKRVDRKSIPYFQSASQITKEYELKFGSGENIDEPAVCPFPHDSGVAPLSEQNKYRSEDKKKTIAQT